MYDDEIPMQELLKKFRKGEREDYEDLTFVMKNSLAFEEAKVGFGKRRAQLYIEHFKPLATGKGSTFREKLRNTPQISVKNSRFRHLLPEP